MPAPVTGDEADGDWLVADGRAGVPDADDADATGVSEEPEADVPVPSPAPPALWSWPGTHAHATLAKATMAAIRTEPTRPVRRVLIRAVLSSVTRSIPAPAAGRKTGGKTVPTLPTDSALVGPRAHDVVDRVAGRGDTGVRGARLATPSGTGADGRAAPGAGQLEHQDDQAGGGGEDAGDP